MKNISPRFLTLSLFVFSFHIAFSQKTPVTPKTDVIQNPIKKKHSPYKTSVPKAQYFYIGNEKIKYAVFHTDTIYISDTSKPFITSIAEYSWDTINSGYIYVIKEQRLFCNDVKPEILKGDLKNMLKIIPENGFRRLSRAGGEFRVNIEEAIYDGGADSVFIAVNIDGFIGADADFEEQGVIGMRYIDLVHYNDSLYKAPDQYPMNRFHKEMTLRQ